jgi:threonine dehydratase
MVTAQMWGTLSRHIFVLIFWYSFIFLSEEYIALAVLRLVEEEKATIEGAGSTGLAACLAGLVPELKGKR